MLLVPMQLMLQFMPGDVLVLLFIVNKLLLLFANDEVDVAADLSRQVSKLSTLKCAAAADSVKRNA